MVANRARINSNGSSSSDGSSGGSGSSLSSKPQKPQKPQKIRRKAFGKWKGIDPIMPEELPDYRPYGGDVVTCADKKSLSSSSSSSPPPSILSKMRSGPVSVVISSINQYLIDYVPLGKTSPSRLTRAQALSEKLRRSYQKSKQADKLSSGGSSSRSNPAHHSISRVKTDKTEKGEEKTEKKERRVQRVVLKSLDNSTAGHSRRFGDLLNSVKESTKSVEPKKLKRSSDSKNNEQLEKKRRNSRSHQTVHQLEFEKERIVNELDVEHEQSEHFNEFADDDSDSWEIPLASRLNPDVKAFMFEQRLLAANGFGRAFVGAKTTLIEEKLFEAVAHKQVFTPRAMFTYVRLPKQRRAVRRYGR